MKKLKLDPETLRVQAFEVSGSAAVRGTVHGRITSYDEWCELTYSPDTCEAASCTCATIHPTCPQTCEWCV
jgi:hypothetical protein